MKNALLLAIGGLLLAGCNPQEEAKPPELLNPTGSAANLPPEEAKRNGEIEAAGQRSAAAADEMARQMRAAKERSGGR